MANYTTSADLLADILDRADELTDGSSDYDSIALKYLNRAYQGIWSGGSELDPEINEVWWWLRKSSPGTLKLLPRQTGTCSVTNDSTSVTLDSDPGVDMDGYRFKISGHHDWFIISSHTTTSVTLDAVYTGEDDTSATYYAYKLEYDLASDVLYLISPMRVFRDNRVKIYGISEREMDDKYPLSSLSVGVPQNFAHIDQDTVRFSHYGSNTSEDFTRVEYDYIYEPSDLADDSNEPLVPRQYRRVLADWGLFFLLTQKEDNRAEGIGLMARQGLRAMASENRRRKFWQAQRFGRIVTRQSDLTWVQGPLRTDTGLIIG